MFKVYHSSDFDRGAPEHTINLVFINLYNGQAMTLILIGRHRRYSYPIGRPDVVMLEYYNYDTIQNAI